MNGKDDKHDRVLILGPDPFVRRICNVRPLTKRELAERPERERAETYPTIRVPA